MPLHRTDAFVLRTYTLKEADKICVLFTRDSGKVRAVAKGARKLRSRFGSSLEPLTEIAVSYYQKENQELVSISTCDIIRSQFSGEITSERLGALHYIAELVIEFLPDHEQNERVYRLVKATVEAMGLTGARELSALSRYFEVWMLRLSGFLPDLSSCHICGRGLANEQSVWLTHEGAPVCLSCSSQRGDELRREVLAGLKDILAKKPVDFFSVRRDGRVLQQIGTLASKLIRRTIERDLKSVAFVDRLRVTNNNH
jgi:DNA repair protein RecO (recombination protein O)